MNNIQVVAHSSYLGSTGYNAHSQAFFSTLNNYLPVRIRNYSYTDNLSDVPQEQLDMIIQQNWNDPPFKIGKPFTPNPTDLQVNIILNESHHHFFYDKYNRPFIFYNVWEATRQIPEFFNRMLEADQFWCPTKWQRQCTIDQGYPAERVKVVPEGVNGNLFQPSSNRAEKKALFAKYNLPENSFVFMIFGRWDYRKSTPEMVQAFCEEFKDDDNVTLILSADNPFAPDGFKLPEENLKHHKITSDKIKIMHFPPQDEYIKWLQYGSCLLQCSRSEGWGLPLMEALACGTPAIASNWGGHLEFADGIAHLVDVPNELPPKNVYMLGDNHDLGVWGEPDFDHMKKVMRDVYNNYSDAKEFALNKSRYIREIYTWDNAALKAEKYIKELCGKITSIPKIQKSNINFNTTFEIIDGKPRVTFETAEINKGRVFVVIESENGEPHHESWFDIEKGLSYWISLNNISNKIKFEVFDESSNSIYSETKYTNDIISISKAPDDMELYQDQYVNGEIISKGKRDCSHRYEAMKKVFSQYKRPFTILDIGANFGYYSIRAVTEYDAVSVMVESENDEIKTLLDLCQANDCRNKLTVMQTRLNLYKLKEISKCEHFDVILGLNILHHFKNEEISEVCEIFTKLGDNLILETPPAEDTGACGQNNLKFIVDYFNDKNGTKLGEFQRHTSNTTSEMIWYKTNSKILEWPYYEYEKLFKRKNVDVQALKDRGCNGVKCTVESDFKSKKFINPRKKETIDWIPGINLKTFINLNGVYPNIYDLIDNLKTQNIHGAYKWDNSNKDIICHNFILNGCNLYMIDFDDTLIQGRVSGDKEQLECVINELKEFLNVTSDEENKVKLNLGCGNVIRGGYINIDKYNNTKNVDYNWDLSKLEVEDGSVDEIYTSHVFEHIQINDIYSVLEEWERALCIGGKIVMRLPNLETEVKKWLDAPDDKKWFEVHRIFGSQSHEGNTHFNGHNPESLKWLIERFNFKVINLGVGNRGYGEEIQLTAEKINTTTLGKANYITHFVNGPFAEVKGDPNDKGFYVFDFLDPDNNSSVHQQMMGINTWTRPYRKYYTNWLTRISRNGKIVHEHKFDLKGKNVLITIDTKCMGDTIAFFPYIKEFKDKHQCNVWVSTFWNKFFETAEEYKELHFVAPGSVVESLYATYSVGCRDNDFHSNKTDWRSIPLQQVACDYLGLEYKEIIPSIGIPIGKRPIKEKYVTISEYSTFQSKFWLYPNGWQTIVDYLIDELGYKVVVISKEKTNLKRVVDWTNSTIELAIKYIAHSDFYIGVSTGPSWLAWALKVPTILISGFTTDWAEMQNCERVINKNVCHGCFNDPDTKLDRGDWRWCPRHKDTPRQFECTKTITPDMVIKTIANITNE